MRICLLSVFDQAAKRYVDPFPAPTVEFAIRGFKEAVMTEGHQFNKFPEDYVLFQVGSFDVESGVIDPCTPVKISQALDFVGAPSLMLEDAADA
mgnify:CR=1 FL=1